MTDVVGFRSLVVARARAAVRVVMRPGAVPAWLGREVRRELAAHHPGVAWRGLRGDRTVVLDVDDREVAVPLRALVARAVAYPPALAMLVAELVRQARETLERGPGPSSGAPLATVAAALMPQVRTGAWFDAHGGRFGDGALVRRPLGADLAIGYVVDAPDAITFVCRRQLAGWGIGQERLEGLARANLRRATPGGLLDLDGVCGPVAVRVGDGYDAARLLLLDPEVHADRPIAVPERDLLWIGAPGPAPRPRALRAAVRAQAAAAVQPISPRIYALRGGRLVAMVQRAGRPGATTSRVAGSSNATGADGSKPTNSTS